MNISIPVFKGVFRSADQADLDPGFLDVLQNAVIRPGKLVKDFGFGAMCDDKALSLAANYTIYRLATMIHASLATPTGYRYFIVAVHDSTYDVKIYYYNSSTQAWTALSISDTYYHKKSGNPIFQTPDAIRFLPGNTGEPDGSNEAKGLWYGHILRYFFWNTIVNANAFYNYGVMPAHDGYDITATDTDVDEAVTGLAADTYYYKLVPIYDGLQEPLLPDDFVSNTILANKVFRVQWTIDGQTWNYRITGFKVYRASATDPAYYHVLTVDTRQNDANLIYKTGALVGYGLYVVGKTWTDDEHIGRKLTKIDNATLYPITDNSGDTLETSSQLPKVWGAQDWRIIDASGTNIFDDQVECGSGFEVNNFTDWGLDGNVNLVRQNVVVYSGSFSGGIALTAGITGDAEVSMSITGGNRYNISAWMRVQAAAAGLEIELFVKDDIDVGWTQIGAGIAGAVYTQVSGIYDSNAGATNLTIKITMNDGAATGWFGYIDELDVDEYAGFDDIDKLYCGINTIIHEDFELGIDDNRVNFRCLVGTDTNGNNDISAERRRITNNVKRAAKVDSDFTGSYIGINQKAYICSNYLWQKNSSTTIDLWFYDYGLVDGAEHPLAGETSIKVNGKFARYINNVGRLFQLNTVLDPGGNNEEQVAGLNYSEQFQPDINPVSNLRLFYDREGGHGTGLAEIFGNPVIMFKQAIFVLDAKSDPANPGNWSEIKSMHNIGNIAEEGYCEALGDLFVVYYDAIYRLSPNNLAETDQTPTESLRISDPIREVYDALSTAQKEAIQAEYNQLEGEVIFRFANDSTWAYNISTGNWREVSSGHKWDFYARDEENNVIILDNTDKKVYGIAEDEAVALHVRTKDFLLSAGDPLNIQKVTLIYKSAVALSLRIYADGDDTTAVATKTIPVAATITELKLAIRYYANRFKVDILEGSGSASEVEINDIGAEII